MRKVQTATLADAALDWAVAISSGREPTIHRSWPQTPAYVTVANGGSHLDWNPTADWRVAGPIIEHEKIKLGWETHDLGKLDDGCWVAGVHTPPQGMCYAEGPTALVAAMRCFVMMKLGETIDIPDEELGIGSSSTARRRA